MNHRLLPLWFLCSVLSTTSIMFGMENQQTLSIFYVKADNSYFHLNSQGNCKPQKNIDLDQLLSPQHPNVFLSYDNNTGDFFLKKSSKIITHVGKLDDELIKALAAIIEYPLYAKLNNNNEYARISYTESFPIPRSNSVDSAIKKLEKKGELDIIDDVDAELKNNKFSLISLHYRTIAQTLATLALVCIIIKYIHHVPQLFNKILHLHYSSTAVNPHNSLKV